jgi:hypothetical protein
VNLQERQKLYAIGEVVGMITFLGNGTKKLRRSEIREVHGRGAKVKFLEGGSGGAFVFWNQIEKLNEPQPEPVPIPEVRENAPADPPPAIVLPPVKPTVRVLATSDDLDALIQMASEISNGIAVEQAQRMAQIKALEAELGAIANEIERLRAEHRLVHEKMDAVRKLGGMRDA